jgi:hypothetical protein
MKKPHVTVICPLDPNRKEEIDNVKHVFNAQTYKRSDLLIAADANTIGYKRNALVCMAKGEIIVHMDSDDAYAKDWIEFNVDFLRANPLISITGLSSAYFRQGEDRYIWEYKGSQKYVCEATMAYWKKIHGGTKVFEERSIAECSKGEGEKFLMGNGRILPHTYIEGFEAQITGKNHVSHLSLPQFRKLT